MGTKIPVLFILVFFCYSCKEHIVDPPNFVVIIGDDITWNDLAAYYDEIARLDFYSGVLNSLRKTLDQWIMETGDTRPVNLTPDEWVPDGTAPLYWLDDHNVSPSANSEMKIIYEKRIKGKPIIYRGTLPGEEKNACKINRKGPY